MILSQVYIEHTVCLFYKTRVKYEHTVLNKTRNQPASQEPAKERATSQSVVAVSMTGEVGGGRGEKRTPNRLPQLHCLHHYQDTVLLRDLGQHTHTSMYIL